MWTSGEQVNRKRALMETDKATTILCTVVGMDDRDLYYRVCSVCEKTLAENSATSTSCRHCNFTNASKRLFRLLVSIATDTEVMVVIMFDRAARVLFGCSADDFFHFAKIHPHAGTIASKALEGTMLTVTLSKPKNGNAQHLRVVSVVPMQTGFQPAIHALRESYPLS